MVLGPQGPGRVGRRRFLNSDAGRPIGATRSHFHLHLTVSPLAIALIVIGALLALLFVGGVIARRRHDRQLAPEYLRHIAEADNALEQARAEDRGWDRNEMEALARQELQRAQPGVDFEHLHLVLVDDRPGVTEDRAHFEAWAGDRAVRVVLSRSDAGWAAVAGD